MTHLLKCPRPRFGIRVFLCVILMLDFPSLTYSAVRDGGNGLVRIPGSGCGDGHTPREASHAQRIILRRDRTRSSGVSLFLRVQSTGGRQRASTVGALLLRLLLLMRLSTIRLSCCACCRRGSRSSLVHGHAPARAGARRSGDVGVPRRDVLLVRAGARSSSSRQRVELRAHSDARAAPARHQRQQLHHRSKQRLIILVNYHQQQHL